MSLSTDIEIAFYGDGGAARHAMSVMEACSLRERRFSLWDVEMEARGHCLQICLGRAALAGIARKAGKVAACAWIDGIRGGGGSVHFICAKEGRPFAHELGKSFLAEAERAGFVCLTAFIPLPFRSTRLFALSMGFVSMGILPAFCRLAPGRTCGGELFRIDFQPC